MTLYYVVADDDDGVPHANSLFVRARSPREAVRYWQEYYSTEEEPQRVDEIPNAPRVGAIRWENVPCVWWGRS